LTTTRHPRFGLEHMSERSDAGWQVPAAGAVATALLIRHRTRILDPNTASGIAALAFIEGTKTAAEPVHVVSSGG
jgi:hypothetical protein